MAVEINAMGKACPMPVVLAKQALDGGENDVTVVVDNQIAVENLTRLAESQGMAAESAPRPLSARLRVGLSQRRRDKGFVCYKNRQKKNYFLFNLGIQMQATKS